MEPSHDAPEAETPEAFAERLKLPFENYRLLYRALTHRSYLNEHFEALEDNERLEFLGDAVLDYLVAYWLYNRFPEMKEGDLTRLRSALVDTNQLAAFARQIGLGPLLRLGRGEEEGGGSERDSLLCDGFEALIGALRLEAGLDAVQKFIAPLLEPAVEIILDDRKDIDPKSRLQEWSQAEGKGIPHYKLINTDGPDHAKVFHTEVFVEGERLGKGSGPSKQKSSIAAAQQALLALGNEN